MLVTSPSIILADKWQKNDPNPTTANYVKELIGRASQKEDSSDRGGALDELNSLFPSDGRRIEFGTAGLRSAMKPGPLGMNDMTVLQTAQGLARYCLKTQQQNEKICAVVGYDHRCNPALSISSLSFAVLTAIVFAEAGIDCILLDGLVLTPLVPFVVKKLGAACGVMVTASHNPKQDDGYKVYASDACQIRAPMDKAIADEILDNLEPWTDYEKIIATRRQEFPNDPCLGLSRPNTTTEMLKEYFKALEDSGLKTGQAKIPNSGANSIDPPKFAYTAMHGIGYPFARQVFETFEIPPFKAVPEQKEPDPTFPTVPFPNPEEKGALDLAKKFAGENGCDIVLANDPDADRLAIAEKDRSSGEWTVFHGDQIGTLLGLWIWEQIGSKQDKVSIAVVSFS
jgi:phosphomannomutase